MMFLIRRHLVSVELNAYKAKMAGQNVNEPSIEPTKPHHSMFRLPWKKASNALMPQLEEKVEEATHNEPVPEPGEAVAGPDETDETVAEPGDEGVESTDQDY
jgi:hypothetical protein